MKQRMEGIHFFKKTTEERPKNNEDNYGHWRKRDCHVVAENLIILLHEETWKIERVNDYLLDLTGRFVGRVLQNGNYLLQT